MHGREQRSHNVLAANTGTYWVHSPDCFFPICQRHPLEHHAGKQGAGTEPLLPRCLTLTQASDTVVQCQSAGDTRMLLGHSRSRPGMLLTALRGTGWLPTGKKDPVQESKMSGVTRLRNLDLTQGTN